MEIYNGNYCVYCHTNKINGKKYIGQTRITPSIRWGSNGCKYKGCRHFWYAIQKYGWDNFDHEIIASGLTLEEANNFESLLIDKLRTRETKYGYNISAGGGNKEISEETLQIWREQRKGNSPFAKKVECEGKVFSSITDCANFYNIKRGRMKDWLNKRSKMPKSFYDKNLHYFNQPFDYECQTEDAFALGNNPRAIPVFCDGKIFSCAKECSNYYGINYHTMMNWLSGEKKMPQEFIDKGLRFEGSTKQYVPQIRNKRKVYCDGNIFSTIQECADFYGVRSNLLSRYLSGNRKMSCKFKELGLKFLDEQ